MKKIFLTIFLTLFLIPLSISAKEVEKYYTNEKNVTMTEEQYNRLVNVFGKISVDTMPQEIFDIEKDIISEKISEKTIYIKTEYLTNANGNIVKYNEEEITKEEYDNAEQPELSPYALYGPIHETEYKYIKITQRGANPGADGGYTATQFILDTSWKVMPKVRSYDIMAFRYQNFIGDPATIWGQIRSTSDGVTYSGYDYTSSSSGYRGGDVGFGISMKLPDSKTVYSIESQISVIGNYTNMLTYGAYGTYQHAAKSLEEGVSKQYYIDKNGMGGVLKFFNNNIAGYYDNTKGVAVGGLNFGG